MANSKQSSSQPKKDQIVEVTLPNGLSDIATPIAILLSAVMVSLSVIYVGTRNIGSEDTLGAADENTTEESDTADTEEVAMEEPGDVLGTVETFTEYDLDICKDGDKPMVFLFSTTWCPHCQWISDAFDSWAKENSDKIAAYHWEIDTNDNTLTDDAESEIPQDHMDIYNEFNPGGSIPTFVFGCRFGRIGNGFESEDSLDNEKAAFTTIMEKLLE